jgi:hypothetical protein
MVKMSPQSALSDALGLIKEISVPIIKAYQVPKTVTKTNEKPIFRSSYDAK